MTKSEKFVADLCKKSFLPFWSFPSPVGKKGNELCDLLVVCQDTIIIISVKDIEPSKHEDESIVYQRWIKKAITESISQIYGAEKYISKVDTIQLKKSDYTITLPSKKDRVIHRIAIAFGSKENYPLPMGFYEKGYVNVFDERSTETILKELDTITDFTEYLVAKQNFLKNNKILFPYEVDLLALYIQTGLSFEAEENLVITGDAAWQAYADSEEYRQWNVDIEVSYVWDIMIQNFYHTIVKNKMSVEKRNEVEIALRIINLESRINRMELGLVMENAFKTKLKARMLKPFEDADYAYVFMPLNSENYETREAELTLRCDIARVEIPNIEKVVGIAIGPSPSREITFELHYIDIPKIDDKFINHARLIKEELGYFKNVRQTRSKDMR